MNFNYLHVIWDVKIFLAKIKDGKGKDLKFSSKKSLLTTIRPKPRWEAFLQHPAYPVQDGNLPMKWKESVAQYLGFTRRERLAILVLVALVLLVFLLPRFVGSRNGSTAGGADTAWISSLRKLEQRPPVTEKKTYNSRDDDNGSQYQYDRDKKAYPSAGKKELFYFDPNTLSTPAWKRLGFRDKTIKIIENYLSKGGRFRKPEDLQRIYGLFPDEYERIAPYIRIAATEEVIAEKEPAKELVNPDKKKPSRYSIIDINTADTTALISLPGIGSKLSVRILNFRDRLGGFYSITQVAEVYGLPDSTFQKIKQYLKLENPVLKKININTVTVDELKGHPYIRYNIANPLVAYRKEHGPFKKLEDLKKVMAVTEEIYQKIAPYLSL